MNNKSLLCFTIASAQDFISAARRTRDAWMGSLLLSYLSFSALEKMADGNPDAIIIPNLKNQPFWLKRMGKSVSPEQIEIASIPTIFTAILDLDKENAKNKAEEAVKSINNKWNEIAKEVKDWVKKKGIYLDSTSEKIWERQINDTFSIFWIVLPWEDSANKLIDNFKTIFEVEEKTKGLEDTWFEAIKDKANTKPSHIIYPLLFDLAGRLLVTRKNLRNFNQRKEPGHKCSLCGIREALHTNQKTTKGFWDSLVEGKSVSFHFKKGEILCAVCTIKRLASEAYFSKKFRIDPDFPSVSSIATASYKREIIRKIKEQKIQRYITKTEEFLKNINLKYDAPPIPRHLKEIEKIGKYQLKAFSKIDGMWLYEESFNSEKIKREYGIEPSQKELLEALTGLKEITDEFGTPPKYFAVLAMDGDRMGDWLTGQRLWEEERKFVSKAYHKGLTSALSTFSLRTVRDIIEKDYPGKLVYAGGDDILAFLPLNCLLDVMGAIRLEFSKSGVPDKLTTSIGAVVAHHTHPLYHIMEEVQKTLKKDAKKRLNRNAFAITLFRRSGEVLSAGCKWILKDIDTMEYLKRLEIIFREEKLSPRILNDLRDAVPGILPLPIDAQAKEFNRLCRRHMDESQVSKEDKDFLLNEFPKILDGLHINMEFGKNVRKEELWNMFTNLIFIAAFLAKES